MLRVLDLFSGIGGFSLGLERTGGFETVAFCEIDPFCRKVLAKHWPHVPRYEDVRTLTADTLRRDGIAVDVICGGFPCQDISTSGHKAGMSGQRSGLWSEYARLIREIRPRFVIVENVAALLGRGLDAVLGDLAGFRYDAQWHSISVADVGGPQVRDRIWIVAYPEGVRPQAVLEELRILSAPSESSARLASDGRADYSANPERIFWPAEPSLVRVADGLPDRMDRIRSIGNAVVPQIPEIIGNAILASMEAA